MCVTSRGCGCLHLVCVWITGTSRGMGALPGAGPARLDSTAGGKTLIFNWYIKQSNRLHNLRPWTKQHAQLEAPGKQRSIISLCHLPVLILTRIICPSGIPFCCVVCLSYWKTVYTNLQFMEELPLLQHRTGLDRPCFIENYLWFSDHNQNDTVSICFMFFLCVRVSVSKMICSYHSN